MMALHERLYTAADLVALPDNGKRYELVNGDLIEMNPPAHKHALISSRLFARLVVYVEQHQLGYVFGPDAGYLLHTDPETKRETVRVPDVSFVREARKSVTLDDLYNGAPDLAIEIISPSETYKMIDRKLQDYFAYGVQLAWLVYPDALTIEVYTSLSDWSALTIEDTLSGGSVLPGFSLPVRDVFSVIL